MVQSRFCVYTHEIQDVAEVAEDRVTTDLPDNMEDDGDGGEQEGSPVESESEEEIEPGSTYNHTQIMYECVSENNRWDPQHCIRYRYIGIVYKDLILPCNCTSHF